MNDDDIVRVSTGYNPRPLQLELHRNMKRFNVLVCHRRFGKTTYSINEMIDQSLRCPNKNPQYAYFAPYYGQAKRVAWDFIKEYTKDLPEVKTNEAELRVEFSRGEDKVRLLLLGADNPGSIRGIGLDGVILDEYSEMDPVVWSQVIRPTLSDRNGWAIFIGTPKGQNHFHDVYMKARLDPDWFNVMYKASETGVINEKELEALKRNMDEEEYNQELECSFSSVMVGSYYGKLLEEADVGGRIKDVPYDPNLTTQTYWDLGIGDSTAIWFCQQIGNEYHLIDYIEETGLALNKYVKMIKEKPYVYSTHYLPHDAAARELGTGKSRQETLRRLGLHTIIVKRQAVDDGIHAVRMTLPKCWFDIKKCERGLSALRNYQKKWDSRNMTFLNTPKHDWSSHGSDAFRTLALGSKIDIIDKRDLPRTSNYEYDIFGGIR
jgi:hypothetical protein